MKVLVRLFVVPLLGKNSFAGRGEVLSSSM